MSSEEVKRTFHREGDVLVIKQVAPTQELNSQQIIMNIDAVQGELDRLQDEIKQAEFTIEDRKTRLEHSSSILKELKRHEEWALAIQTSKIKAVIEEVADECRTKVEANYTYDPALEAWQNDAQRFIQYRQYIAHHPKMVEAVAPRVAKKELFEKVVLGNPWKSEPLVVAR